MTLFVERICFAIAVIAVLSSFLPYRSALAQHDEELEEIIITSTRTRRSFEDQPTRVEVLGGEEINEKGF